MRRWVRRVARKRFARKKESVVLFVPRLEAPLARLLEVALEALREQQLEHKFVVNFVTTFPIAKPDTFAISMWRLGNHSFWKPDSQKLMKP
jgi:hypothetical protein